MQDEPYNMVRDCEQKNTSAENHLALNVVECNELIIDESVWIKVLMIFCQKYTCPLCHCTLVFTL